MANFRVEKVVNKPVVFLEQLFWNINLWTSIWSPIAKVNVNYDDGILQEFSMLVDMNGSQQIKTIRMKSQYGIDFFTPIPPTMMRSHSGTWQFVMQQHQCLIIATRDYQLYDTKDSDNSFHVMFERRVANILNKFAEYCDES